MNTSDHPLSLNGCRWELASPDATDLGRARVHGLSPAATQVLALRLPEAPSLLSAPSLADLHDPYLMTGMAAAVERIERALQNNEHIRIITDYDVDGTTSSLILQACLRLLKPSLTLDYHIPDRFAEGYGFSAIAAEKAADDGVSLIITADIGVRDHAAVAAAKAKGVDVLICDHHLPDGADVPSDALVLCPPQGACDYPNPSLAACGVSLKLAQALLSQHPKAPAVLRSLLKLAAIGTVADLVPLTTAENRAIVRLGLAELNHGRHAPGLRALLEVCDLTPGEIDESSLGFRVGPRINAAGRIHRATHVIELLTCREPQQAQALAKELDNLNQERRSLQQRLADKALESIDPNDPGLAFAAGPEDEGWHRGVVGIVAAKLKEKTHKMSVVVSIQGDNAVGSVRSIPGVHAVEVLSSAEDLLTRFGGHPAAAGFALPTEQLPALEKRLSDHLRDYVPSGGFIKTLTIDAEVTPQDLSMQLHHQLRHFAPFGQGNPEPKLLIRGLLAQNLRTMGKDRTHLKWELPGRRGEAVWWRSAEHQSALTEGPIDVVATLSENNWRGRRTLQLRIIDARRSA